MEADTPMNILLVDDEVDFLNVLSKRLEARGFAIDTATNGKTAIASAKDKAFDVIVLDLSMPDIDGIETLKQIKKDNPDMQVIVLTGHATVEKSVDAMKEGAVDFLEKPVDLSKLIEKMKVAHEIAEKKKIEQQMAHTEKLASLGTLAAGIAHEINNPLTIILGFADLMLEKVPHDSEFYELLKTIERQGQNAKRIVENLLGFARYTEYREEDVDINKNIRSVLAVVESVLTTNRISVSLDLSESLPIIRGSFGELQQVFFNIINNAIHEMKGGGMLTVASRAVDEGKRVEIQIADTGPGIKQRERAKIFDPFFTTKKVGEGTGLGLSIAYGIIDKHGGTVSFDTRTRDESNAPGTKFIITLPVVK